MRGWIAGFAHILMMLLAAFPFLRAQQQRIELPSRAISLQKGDISLEDALAEVKAQTALEVADRRAVKSAARLKLDLQAASFWQGLESIAKQANARISVHQADGKVALVDGPYRSLPTSVQGIFRTLVKRIALARDLESGMDTCTIRLETTWEPWFQPFYLEVGASVAGYTQGKKTVHVNVSGPGQDRVAGRSAVEPELRLAAPPRAVRQIDFLKGAFKVIGARMLTFRFENLKPGPKGKASLISKHDGVVVQLGAIVRTKDHWSFEVYIENPPGGPAFESFQSRLEYNRLYLEKGQGKSRQTLRPNPEDEEPVEDVKTTATHAAIRYHFHLPGRSDIGKLEDWTLVYVAPGRFTETVVEFAFKDLALP